MMDGTTRPEQQWTCSRKEQFGTKAPQSEQGIKQASLFLTGFKWITLYNNAITKARNGIEALAFALLLHLCAHAPSDTRDVRRNYICIPVMNDSKTLYSTAVKYPLLCLHNALFTREAYKSVDGFHAVMSVSEVQKPMDLHHTGLQWGATGGRRSASILGRRAFTRRRARLTV
jgi:hypothetical protein